ncbi:hypothetical protein AVEN_114856-1 [Araneus ventricosus]|uniref:Uncharacterized protein n=1 Tax=Araneus ventricosus TaxID=182803 RepID=A0A4Y2QYR1_ARAVE|nr:hypothetical protein AVEN_114856-1 [Araneus ventricosus]
MNTDRTYLFGVSFEVATLWNYAFLPSFVYKDENSDFNPPSTPPSDVMWKFGGVCQLRYHPRHLTKRHPAPPIPMTTRDTSSVLNGHKVDEARTTQPKARTTLLRNKINKTIFRNVQN